MSKVVSSENRSGGMDNRVVKDKPEQKYRVGIVGLGRIASLLEDDPLRGKPATHAGAFAKNRSVKIVAGCDIDGQRLEQFGKRWGVKKLYQDYREMLGKERLDILSVASWTQTHSEIVSLAAESGVRGIYCEKPMALNLVQAKRMVRACRANNSALVIGHERRWHQHYRVIHDMLKAGKLGCLKSITGYTLSGAPPKLSRRKHGGGTMFHDGTHLVDLLHYFAGEAESVIGIADRPYGEGYVESSAVGAINFKSGVKGMVMGGGERDYFHFELDIQTDKARVLLGNHIAELYLSKPSKRFTGFKELVQVPFPDVGARINPFEGGVADLINEMETGEPSVSGGKDGYMALETIMALYRSAGKGGEPVRLPL